MGIFNGKNLRTGKDITTIIVFLRHMQKKVAHVKREKTLMKIYVSIYQLEVYN